MARSRAKARDLKAATAGVRGVREESTNGAKPLPKLGKQSASAMREDLAKKLFLADNGLSIVVFALRGQGSGAEVEMKLSNGQTVQAPRFGDLWSHGGLAKWITQSTGVNANAMTKDRAAEANALMRRLAGWADRETTAGDLGAEHGVDFLKRASREAFNFTDQTSRYSAFAKLDAMDPIAVSDPRLPRSGGKWEEPPPLPASIADAAVVLEHTNGALYVRCDWLLAHVRRRGEVAHAGELVRRMVNAGWTRPGKRGRIKATSASTGKTIILPLWVVPPGWAAEQGDES